MKSESKRRTACNESRISPTIFPSFLASSSLTLSSSHTQFSLSFLFILFHSRIGCSNSIGVWVSFCPFCSVSLRLFQAFSLLFLKTQTGLVCLEICDQKRILPIPVSVDIGVFGWEDFSSEGFTHRFGSAFSMPFLSHNLSSQVMLYGIQHTGVKHQVSTACHYLNMWPPTRIVYDGIFLFLLGSMFSKRKKW